MRQGVRLTHFSVARLRAESRVASAEPGVKGQAALHLDYVSVLLADREFIVGSQLTAADIQVTFSLQGAKRSQLIGERANLDAYIERMEHRPAYERAIEKGGPFKLGFG